MIKRASLDTNINHERWLVSYADFVTLLFAFFVVMYSISQVNESKYKELSSVLEQVFTNIDDEKKLEKPQPVPQHLSVLEEVEANILEALADFINSNDAIVEGTESWVEIEINANLLFDSGNAVPTARAREAFASLALQLAPLSNEISVAGHTDNRPIRTAEFRDNWQLSTARAVQVVNLLVSKGVAPERLSAIGYGEFRPVADNNTERGRLLNRRVVLRVSKSSPTQAAQRSSLSKSKEPLQPQPQVLIDKGQVSKTGRAQQSPPQSSTAATDEQTAEAFVDPVRLQEGGLLFTSDPNHQRKSK